MKPMVSFLKHPSSFQHTLSDFDTMYDEVLHMDTTLPVEDKLLHLITAHPLRCLQLALVTYFCLLLSLQLFLSYSVTGMMKDNWLKKKLYTYANLSAVGIALIDIVANFQMPERLSDVLAGIPVSEETKKTATEDEKQATREGTDDSAPPLDIPTPPAAESSPEAAVEQVKMRFYKQLMEDLQAAVLDKSSLLVFFAILSWMVLSSKDSGVLWSITSMSLGPHIICALGLWLSLGHPSTASSVLTSLGILSSAENSSDKEEAKGHKGWSVNRSTLETMNSISQVSSLFSEVSILIPTALTLLRSPSKGKSLIKQMLDLLLLQNYLWARCINVSSLLPALSSKVSGQLQESDSIISTFSSSGRKLWNTLKEKATDLLSSSTTPANNKPIKSKKKKAVSKKKKQKKAPVESQPPTTSIDEQEHAETSSEHVDLEQATKSKDIDIDESEISNIAGATEDDETAENSSSED